MDYQNVLDYYGYYDYGNYSYDIYTREGIFSLMSSPL